MSETSETVFTDECKASHFVLSFSGESANVSALAAELCRKHNDADRVAVWEIHDVEALIRRQFRESTPSPVIEGNDREAELLKQLAIVQGERDELAKHFYDARLIASNHAEHVSRLKQKLAALEDERDWLREELAETKKPCAICQRRICDAIGNDWCVACDADERLHAAKAANDELAKTIARMTEDAELAKRIKESSSKMCAGVWADHQKQFDDQTQEIKALRTTVTSLREVCEGASQALQSPVRQWDERNDRERQRDFGRTDEPYMIQVARSVIAQLTAALQSGEA